MKTLRLLPFFILLSTASFSQIGKNGDVLITNTQIVNEYTALSQDANPGDMSLTVLNSGLNTNGNFSSPLEAGDLIMIIQTQGATIQGNVNDITWGEILNYNNCGLFEFKEVANVPNGTQIELTCPVENAYTESGNVQVVRVPRYNTLTIDGGTITAQNWDGIRGGIVAIEVNGLTTLINGGKIDVTGQGFRGGLMDNASGYAALDFAYNAQNMGGEKGESIAGFGPEYAPLGGRFGRGAPANGGGGGNAHNAGGGGGANAGSEIPWNGQGNPDNSMPGWTTAWNLEGGTFSGNLSSGGGRGGYTFSMSNQNALILGPSQGAWGGDLRRNTGGIGGRPLDYSSGRLFFGGGGGAGDGNNGAGTNGASGGGMVYLITYNDIVGNGQIIASGQTAPPTPPAGNDAPGGGGGGGTIVVNTSGTISSTISLTANGGNGGNQIIASNEAEGPGGGGGGGYVAWSNGTPSASVAGGANGITNSLGVTEFVPNGATKGGAGKISFPIITMFNMSIVALDDTVCYGTSATLTAGVVEDPSYNNMIQWFDAPYGGNLLATGSTYTTPNLFANTTLYLKVCPSLTIDSVTVVVQSNPVFAVVTDSVTCYNGNDGSATINSPGSYSYLWSNGQAGTFAFGFAAGNYSVVASTSFGCSTSANFTIFQPSPMNLNFSGTPALCYNDPSGTLTCNASGGTAPYNYQWVSPSVNGSTLTNVPNGSYTVNVSDANGCQGSATGSVTSPLPIAVNVTALTDVSCYEGTNGSVEVEIIGGTAPYNIDWLTLTNDSTIMENLSAGNYVAEITDANNCTGSVVATVSEPMPFTVDLVVIADETCSAGNGLAIASTSGGIGTLTYTWTPNVSTTNVASNLSAGPIQVIVQDENGCVTNDAETISNFATGTPVIASLSPVTCQNGANGSVTVDMIGGTAPFFYTWSCICPDSNSVSGLSAGTYSVQITDDNGCIDSIDVIMDELPALVLSTASITEPLCYGDTNGSAQVQATGGTGPFFFSWNTMPAQYNPWADNLNAGTYSVIVTDANSCADTIDVTIDQPSQLNAQTTILSNNLCYGDSSGVVYVAASGGIQPYNYSWSNGSVLDTITDLTAGIYYVEVTDDNGCKFNTSASIVQYQFVTADLVGDTVFCPGDLITFQVLTNGMNNLYDYNWYVNGNLQSTQNTFTIPVFSTTVINIELVHQANCPSILDTITVSPIQIDPGILTMTGTQDTLCQGTPGFVQANISDWEFITDVYWSSGNLNGPGPHVVKPSADQYFTVTVENMCGQTIQDSILLNVFLPPSAYIYASNTEACEEVNAEFGFGYDAYLYTLTNATWNILHTNYSGINPIITFEYTIDFSVGLDLTFSNGCTFTYADSASFVVYPAPDADFYYNPDPAMQGELTEFIDISHGNPIAWEWYTQNEFFSTDERPTWIYSEQGNFVVTQIVTNEFGCSDTAQHVVEVIGDFLVFVPNAFTPDGNGYNNTFKPVFQNVKPDNYNFMIFNRWGELIFEAHDLDAEWDGVYAGDVALDDVYVWVIQVTDNRDIEHEYKGHVTLLK